MKTFATLALVLALLGSAVAQTPVREEGQNTRSYSGQFFVHAAHTPTAPDLAARLTAGGNYLQLDAALLTVSCERIKTLLWRKLGDKPSWRGRIHLYLRATRGGDESVRMVAEKFSDGWRYQVQLPDVIERERFLRTIVQVLLVEIANRNADERSTEIPVWLVEGLATELLAAGDMAGELKLLLTPPDKTEAALKLTRYNVNERRTNSLYWARVVLGAQPPLTFEQLSWPAADQLATEASEVYQSSAQLLVNRLLEFKDGPACFHALLNELPRHLNWQLAFQKAFHAHFQSMLDVEKWWAVEVSHFTGRELERTWSFAESWRKLDELIHAPVQVQTGAGEQPLRTEVNLQTILRSANGLEQADVFRQKLTSLDSLRLRAAPELVGLVDDYRRAIGTYLQKQASTNPFLPFRKWHGLVVNRAARELARQLDALQVRREALRPAPPQTEPQLPADVSAAFR